MLCKRMIPCLDVHGGHGHGRSHNLSLELNLFFGIGAGYDNHWRDIAQLRSDGLLQQRFTTLLAFLLFRAGRPPDDLIVGFVGTGEMNLVYIGMVDQVPPNLSTTIDYCEIVAVYGSLESLLDVWPQISIDGVHLEQTYLALVKHLGDDIHHANRSDIARP